MKQALRRRGLILGPMVALVCIAAGFGAATTAAAPVSGAIFTTDSTCTGVNLNIYNEKTDVYVDGGPAHPGAAGLPDGEYYVQVTAPNGTLLGTSVGSADETPVVVKEGEFESCYQLWAILIKASDGEPGYDDSPNNGDEYKVWISTVSSFDNSQTKTDNFKVNGEGCEPECGPPPSGTLTVEKCYDANADGECNPGELKLTGWKVRIQDNLDWIRYTDATVGGPLALILDPDKYCVSEFDPVQSNWVHTGVAGGTPINPIPAGEKQCDSAEANPSAKTAAQTDLLASGAVDIEFANLCLGQGGGLTLGFWSNKNGQKLFGADDLALMVSLNLRKADGTEFNPKNYSEFRTWLLNATATNMAYMLSAQLAAMELNVLNGFVKEGALIYAPGTISANKLGFATVGAVMIEANNELGLHGKALSGDSWRSYQEALKNALDKANNNLTFVQGEPCPFEFE